MKLTKQTIVNHVNRICCKSSCFLCSEADKYDTYENCPYINLKEIAMQRRITIDDIPEELTR